MAIPITEPRIPKIRESVASTSLVVKKDALNTGPVTADST
jgi:hypothetical protein